MDTNYYFINVKIFELMKIIKENKISYVLVEMFFSILKSYMHDMHFQSRLALRVHVKNNN